MRVRRQQGYTLTELLIVISLLALIAAIAIPDFSSDDTTRLDIATADVVGAIRFAHSEAIRTGEIFGVHADKSNQRLRVYRVDTSVDPAAIRYDNFDPLTKQPYELRFSAGESGVTLTEVDFSFTAAASTTGYLGFAGGSGVPAADGIAKLRMLDSAYVLLTYGNDSRRIDIAPMTGRVTVR
jgi:prepilin-type N-terminal cleavage/methylation domain-containing protein